MSEVKIEIEAEPTETEERAEEAETASIEAAAEAVATAAEAVETAAEIIEGDNEDDREWLNSILERATSEILAAQATLIQTMQAAILSEIQDRLSILKMPSAETLTETMQATLPLTAETSLNPPSAEADLPEAKTSQAEAEVTEMRKAKYRRL